MIKKSKALPCFYENQKYFDGENWITIFSKFEFIRRIKTYDDYTSICGEVKTPLGTLILYGSIIGSMPILEMIWNGKKKILTD
ncbi:MAG: hypothetical protein EZS26_002386 [Candidatus Ordinivivax streblomastigis]|uniref:Uncharacterized protein n=1 Tax=Candidatus Ordinivivax streblomastigis TaxID=2540710 RepID=A0A5M8NZ15_9BACT|nr:MAG: hypothetical protein EZS26_002386 [Candidatus Ordinivivax streblomastigis]